MTHVPEGLATASAVVSASTARLASAAAMYLIASFRR
jgi:hypothetical protein